MSKASRRIIFGAELRRGIAAGLEQVYRVAEAAYGPGAGTALIELPYGDPLISRDGVTNVEHVYLEDPIENMAARIIVQASKKNNRKVGDGTTAVVILAYHLHLEAQKRIAAGINPMVVARELERVAVDVVDQIDKMKKPVTDKLLQHVAVVSAGDEAIGNMIADIIKDIGLDGGVTVEDFAGSGIYNELVDGFYFRKGFTNVNLTNDPSNLESRHEDVSILLTEKKMALSSDIVPILEKIVSDAGTGKELILVGEVSEEVLGVLLLNRLKGIINVTPVDLPVFGPLRSLTLEDLALVTGGRVFTPGANASDFELSMLGGAKKVTISEFSTTIIDGDGAKEDLDYRIGELRQQLKEADSPGTVDALKDRLARLTGKVAIIRVGGATEIEQKEVKLRVEDAICAVQAAIKDGIVPGGGVALIRVASNEFTAAFVQPFRILMKNAGLDPEKLIWRVGESPNIWQGFDLRSRDNLPIDMLKIGIIDPALVVKETVRNATSVVAKLITTAVAVIYTDREQKHD